MRRTPSRHTAVAAWAGVALVFAAWTGCGLSESSEAAGGAGTGGAGGEITGAGGHSSSRTSSATSGSSGGSGPGTGASGATGGSGGSAGAGGKGGASCNNTDPGEPNDDEPSAYKLDNSDMTDCSDDNVGTVFGVLAGDEADWFTYDGIDGTFTAMNPNAQVTADDGVTVLRVCIFLQCLDGSSTDVTCPDGTVAATSPMGRPGCCGTEPFEVDLDCADTSDETSEVYMRVDDPTHTNVCASYTLTWHC